MEFLKFYDLSYNSWYVQDIEPCILHLYTLDLSTNRFLQLLGNLCENMQATTDFAASFPPGSAAYRSFKNGLGHWIPLHAWKQVWGPG